MGELLDNALRETDEALRLGFEKILPPQKLSVESGEDRLWEAIRYVLMGGGKRIRPFLVRQFGSVFNISSHDIMQVAMAVEAIHCYSLVHDDLPAMDDDDERRGKPSLHVAYDEATAILAGDALQALGFRLLADVRGEGGGGGFKLVGMLADAVGGGGMVGGQMLDIVGGAEGAENLTRVQRLKTGCLFSFSCESMGVLGGVGDDVMASVRGYAHDLGLAFQMSDDLLDGDGWVGLIGEGGVRRQVGLLCGQAGEHVRGLGGGTNLLCELAEYVGSRKA